MENLQNETTPSASSALKPGEFRTLIQEAVREFVSLEQAKSEPAVKAELEEERRRREQLERKMNDLIEENRRSRQMAEEADRNSAIRTELQRLGVQKVDLAWKAVKDEIVRSQDGQLVARTSQGDVSVKDYLNNFVQENPELLPARISGGSGAAQPTKTSTPTAGSFDLDKIRPGMSMDELERARQEIARVAMQLHR